MIGSSRSSLALVRDTVNSRYGQESLGSAGRELLQVADLLGREKQLRSSLADSGRPGTERAAVVRQLLGDRIGREAVAIAATIASQRWSSESDLVDAYEFAGAQAMFAAAEQHGELDEIENELFKFGRVVSADGELQLALSSPSLPPAGKQGILSDLLTGRVSATTIELLGFVTSHLRGRRVDQAIEGLSRLAADRRGELVAVVRSARPLDEDQAARLSAVLERIYGQSVSMNTEVDPALVGGITVQIGDEVIDGSMAGRLNAAKRQVSG